MSGALLAYIFIFLGIFFESFMLVTFLSKPARTARARPTTTKTPHVALIIPCYNEEDTVELSIKAALRVDYPADKFQLVVVNDGSKDKTWEIMQKFKDHPQILLINQKNGGKHTALNAGIAATTAEIVGCLDADTVLEPDALKRTLVCFDKPNVAAAMSSISIRTPRGLLERMQSAEYTVGIFYRHALSSINAMYVTPGPFSLYRRSVLEKVGGFVYGQQTEDMEMALRLQREGYEIDNMPRALVTTHAMDTLPKLMRQRMRWTSGFFRNVLFDYRDLLSYKHGVLGYLILPFGLIAPIAILSIFSFTIYRILHAIITAFEIRQGIPFDWYFHWPALLHTATWFYTPISIFGLLGIIAAGLGIAMMVVGKRVSNAPTNLFADAICYLLLYGFVAPLWYLRATADVITGTRRGWRIE
ncbi:MAG TPA: glycosyltransferase [Candidatus Paceibacterota bacterium]|nr:glycosyltransferase [Candidatus Paceibacterota bacterium]